MGGRQRSWPVFRIIWRYTNLQFILISHGRCRWCGRYGNRWRSYRRQCYQHYLRRFRRQGNRQQLYCQRFGFGAYRQRHQRQPVRGPAEPVAAAAGNTQGVGLQWLRYTVKTVPNMVAPSLTTTLSDTCMGSSSFGLSVVGFGATGGTTMLTSLRTPSGLARISCHGYERMSRWPCSVKANPIAKQSSQPVGRALRWLKQAIPRNRPLPPTAALIPSATPTLPYAAASVLIR